MSHRGDSTDEPGKDPAVLQELSAGVVHGVYRLVKACQFHADVTNDAVTALTTSAVSAVVDYCAHAGVETVALSFLGDAIFVNRQILKASRDTHALAAELGELLGICGVTELTLSKTLERSEIATLAKLLADVQRDRTLVAGITSNALRGIHVGLARFAATGAQREESPGQRAARTYATSVLTVQSVLGDVRRGKFELPRRIKRVAQQVVARADEDARLLVALAATGGVSHDAATVAVSSAILAVAMTRQLTTDRAVLANAAMTALLYDVGRVILGGAGEGPQRLLNDDELDRVPARTVVALTALGRMHAPARARTALLYEVWSMRRAHRHGAVYQGRRPPTLLARIIGVARAFAELRGAGAGGGLSIDDGLQVLGSRAEGGTEKALVKLLIGALGIYPAGTMVTLNTGELGVVMGTPAQPLDYVRPPIKILYDAYASLLDTPIDLDLAALPPGSPMRFIAKSVEADEQQGKAMRAFVVAAQAAKRRGALDATPPPRPAPEQTLQSMMRGEEPAVTRRPPLPVTEASPASLRRPSGGIEAAMPSLRQAPMINELTPRSSQSLVPATAKRRRSERPRKRDPRNDSAPPSSMQDEVHQPVRIIPVAPPPRIARPAVAAAPPTGASAIDSDALTIRPPSAATLSTDRPQLEEVHDELEEVHDELQEVHDELEEVHDELEELPQLEEVDRSTATTAPPPSETKEKQAPVSERDAMLARFLADAPISGTTVPPEAIERIDDSRPTVVPKKK